MSLKYYFLFFPNMGYYFKNELNIVTSNLCMNYINPSNQKRLDLIMKLHKKGKSNKKIVEILKVKGIKRRNKNDEYSWAPTWSRVVGPDVTPSRGPRCGAESWARMWS